MRLKMTICALAAMLATGGLGVAAHAAEEIDQAPPLDLGSLGDVQSGVGVSSAAVQTPSADEMFGETNARMADANAKVADGITAASQAVAADGGNKDAEAMLYALPYIYSAVPTAVGAIEQGASAATSSVGSALGGTLDLAGALQGIGTGVQ